MMNVSNSSSTVTASSVNYAYVYACFLAVCAYSGLFGAILLIIVLLKGRLLKEPSYIIMFSLALADIGNISIMTFHSLPERIINIHWPDAFERAANRAILVFWYTALSHYVVMASYRFIAVRYPFKMSVWFSVQKTVLFITLTWIVGLCVFAISFTGICCDQIFAIHENLDPAIETATDEVGEINYLKKATNIIDIIVIVALILIYVSTSWGINNVVPSVHQNNPTDLRQQSENKRRSAQAKRVGLQFAIITAIFGFLVTAEALSESGIGGAVMKAILQIAFILNAGANVVIYSTFNSTFRQHLIETVLFWRKKTTNKSSQHRLVNNWQTSTVNR